MYRNSICLYTVIDKEKVKLVVLIYRKNGLYIIKRMMIRNFYILFGIIFC